MEVSFAVGSVAAVEVSFVVVRGAIVAGGKGMRVRVLPGLGTGLERSDGRVTGTSVGEGVISMGRAPPLQPTQTNSMSIANPTPVRLTLARPL